MQFLLIAPALVVLFWGASRFTAWRRRQKALERIRTRWTGSRDRERNFEDIALYFDLTRDGRPGALDDATWRDLDLDAVFGMVDRCESPVGQQRLYARLRTGADEQDLERFDGWIEHFRNHPRTRESVLVEVSRLSSDEAYFLPWLFLDALPDAPPLARLFPLLGVAVVAGIALTFWNPAFIALVIPLILTNIGIHLTYRKKVFRFIQPLRLVAELISAARALGRANLPELEDISRELRDLAVRLRSLERMASWLRFETEGGIDDPVRLLYQYLNMFLIVDVSVFVYALGGVRREQKAIRRIFERVGDLDAAVAVASFRDSLAWWCTPRFDAGGRSLEAEDLFHPLIAEAVPNTLRTGGDSILITGSNMSGKSTFLRTIGVNVVLAQTIRTVAARAWCAPRFRLATSIGRSDSLLEGKSYYLAEVERIGEMLHRSEENGPWLFLLDELFRGTNTVERVAAGKAVLQHLNRGNHLLMVATHDLELLDLLGEEFTFVHFRESVDEGGLSFDYRLRDGVSSTRNAIALLELMGFPEEVVEDANRTVESRER